MPAIFAMAYHSLVGSSGPVSSAFPRSAAVRTSDRCRRSRETPSSRPASAGGSCDVRFDHQIVVKEIRRIRRVGENAADLCRSHEDGLRPRRCEKSGDLLWRTRSTSPRRAVMSAHPSQASRRRSADADHAVMAGDIHLLAAQIVEGSGLSGWRTDLSHSKALEPLA